MECQSVKEACILANGEFRHAERLLPLVREADLVIAADGGANWLAAQGLIPDILVGDMDSVTDEVRATIGAQGARLVTALAEIEPQIADIRRKKAELADIQANVDADHSFYKVARDLYERTPDGVMYLTIEFEKKKQVTLQGRAGKDDEVYNLINVLKESPHFQDVIPGNLRWQQMYRQPVREFDITCILKSNEEYRRPRTSRTGARR